MKHFLIANPRRQAFRSYKKFDARIFGRCRSLAKAVKGLKVIHINSSAAGGGVAELLKTQVPLERDVGLDSRWLVLRGRKQFFFVTKKIHNLLQGQKGFLSEPEKKYYIEQLRQPGQELQKFLERKKHASIIVLHDPQVLPLIDCLPPSATVIVRLHIDLSVSSGTMLRFLKPFLEKAEKIIVSHPRFRPAWLDRNKTLVSRPAINPFALKNRPISPGQIQKYFKLFGIDALRPVAAQVSRFDPWKDPEGVIEAYYLAKKQIPGLQMVLEGAMEAKDDPQAAEIYNRLKMEHKNDSDLFLHGRKTLSGDAYQRWVNALQAGARVIVQKSLREGFGLTVTEALWKRKAVIGGNALGIRAQIRNGRSGFIVSSPEECAMRIVRLIKNPRLAQKLGDEGRETVKQKFLFNRLILDFLKIYKQL